MKSNQFIAPLHGLRGIAALLVVYSQGHAGGYIKLPGSGYAGSMGVALFFVLSGFLMAHLYLPQKLNACNAKKYIVARFARIYPLFSLVVIISGVMYLFYPSWPFSLDAWDVLLHLGGMGSGRTIWTISTELQFYCVFILLWAAHTFIFQHRDLWMAASIVLLALLLKGIGYSDDRILISGYLHIFLAGMLAAIGYRNIKKVNYFTALEKSVTFVFPLLAILWGYAAYIAPATWGGRWIFQVEWLMLLTAVMVFFSCINLRSIWSELLASRILTWLGEISFGVYLLHRPVIWLLSNFTPWLNSLPWPIRATIFTFSLLLFAHVCHRLIEVPCRSFLRGDGLSFFKRSGTVKN